MGVMQEDIEYIHNSKCIPWEKLFEKNILITGATGLIGKMIVNTLYSYNVKHHWNMRLYLSVRDASKAKQLFSFEDESCVYWLEGDITECMQMSENVDYIVHGASPTSGTFFVEKPVETIKTIVNGTMAVLDFALEKKTSSLVYLSSMEVYGALDGEQFLKEEDLGYLDYKNPRDSYPQGKRLAEQLCVSYAKEYGIHTSVIRLAQVFGAGVDYNEPRVYGMMARSAIEGNNIVLQTKGNSKRSYLYLAQAVEAIMVVLLRGESGEIYNAANPDTFCSILDMGKMVAEKCTNKNVQIICSCDNCSQYPKAVSWNMDITKIRGLGWNPSEDLMFCFARMIQYMKEQKYGLG